PLATTIEAADAVATLAARGDVVCAVGHLTLHQEGLASMPALGRIERVSAYRTSLGALHTKESALSGLAAHDVATLIGPLGLEPRSEARRRSGPGARLRADLARHRRRVGRDPRLGVVVDPRRPRALTASSRRTARRSSTSNSRDQPRRRARAWIAPTTARTPRA